MYARKPLHSSGVHLLKALLGNHCGMLDFRDCTSFCNTSVTHKTKNKVVMKYFTRKIDYLRYMVYIYIKSNYAQLCGALLIIYKSFAINVALLSPNQS